MCTEFKRYNCLNIMYALETRYYTRILKGTHLSGKTIVSSMKMKRQS